MNKTNADGSRGQLMNLTCSLLIGAAGCVGNALIIKTFLKNRPLHQNGLFLIGFLAVGDLILGFFSLSLTTGTAGCLGNAVILATFLRHQYLQQNGLILVAFLAVGDFILEFGIIYHSVLELLEKVKFIEQLSTFYCTHKLFLWLAGMHCSQASTLVLARDRYRALAHPIQYYNEGKKPLRAVKKLSLILVWSFGNASVSFAGADWKRVIESQEQCRGDGIVHRYFQMYQSLVLFVISILVCYYYIRALCSLESSNRVEDGQTAQQRHAQLQRKITKTVVSVLTAYFILWLFPSIVFTVTTALNLRKTTIGHVTHFMSQFGASLNSAINVLLYGTKSSIIRPYLIATLKNTVVVNSLH